MTNATRANQQFFEHSTTDVHISAANVEPLPYSEAPEELKQFVMHVQAKYVPSCLNLTTDINGHPSPMLGMVPLMFTLNNVPYILNSTSNIRQSYHKIALNYSTGIGVNPSTEAELLMETTIDPEGEQNFMVCKVCVQDFNSLFVPIADILYQLVCDDIETQSGWEEFLTKCDYLTQVDQPSRKSPHSPMAFQGIQTGWF